MSGGVDSSVAAALLKEQGYDCVGVFMRVGSSAAEESCQTGGQGRRRHGCCSADDGADARAVAGRLGIPFYALNFQDGFESIVEYFLDEYEVARTPNPCIMCNIHLKFGRLLRYADLVGAEFVATGHYARIVSGPDGAALHRAANRAKDQSYVLFGISRAALPRSRFPLGEFADKAEVRAVARALEFRVHDKPDSQEICFVPNQDYRALLRARRPHTRKPGEVRHSDGRVLATHDGVSGFTIGQRRGLGVAVGLPVYVSRLDPVANTVYVGPRSELLAGGLIANRLNWHVDPPADDGTEMTCSVQIRHQHSATPGRLRLAGEGSARVSFDVAQTAVTPGQAAVFYADDRVLGGGWIVEALREHEH